MTSNNDSNNMEEISEEIAVDESVSIDDFIKELEEKEKDLHISSEMVIEVEESEIDETHISDIPNSLNDGKHKSLPPDTSIYKTISPLNSAPNQIDVSAFKAEISRN